MSKHIDLTNQIFGRWTVIESVGYRPGSTYWLCRCSCGIRCIVNGNNLKRGITQSCGCLKAEGTHGLSRHPLYRVWADMLQRCRNPKNRWFHRYGGRGITVCDSWTDFENFYADVGERPFPKASLDRIDNDSGYEPGNVRWATQRQQMQNRGSRS